MKARTRKLILIFFAVAALTASAFAVKHYFVGQKYRTSLEYSYARSLGDLTDDLGMMANALERSRYCSTSTLQHEVSTALISYGGSAKTAVSYLPFSQEKAAGLERLISAAEDYAYYTGRKISAGGSFSQEDLEVYGTMEQYISMLQNALEQIRLELGENNLQIGKTERLLENTLEIPDTPLFDDSLEDVAEELGSFPTLLYDGPFSSHIQQKTALFLEGKEEISPEEAIKIAADFLDTDKSSLRCENETQGALAAYEIRGENQSVNVTKAGGEVSWAKKTMDIGSSTMGYEDALKKAREFLEESGRKGMREGYYVTNDNTCTINFYGDQDGVLLYPDLIKVVVELNEGGIVEYEAEGYLMNHRERENLSPTLSEEEARDILSDNLTAETSALAVIPTPGKDEVLCYQFLCKSEDGKEVLVYINSETGLEEEVYLIERTETGTLRK